jgi:hypothetical protein
VKKATTIAVVVVLATRGSAAMDVPLDLDNVAIVKWNALKAAGYKSSRLCDPNRDLGANFRSCVTEIFVRQNGERILLREKSTPGGMTHREICFESRMLSHSQLLCREYGPTPQS